MASNNSAASNAQLKYATDYDLTSIVLFTAAANDSIELKDKMVELNYFEDVYSPSISGKLVVSDAIGLLNLASINGTEFLKIIFQKTNDSSITISRTFRVFSVTDKTLSNNNNFENYTINFCSEEFLISQQYRISKSYKNKEISDIIADILNTFLKVGISGSKSVYVESTRGKYDFILPNKKIFETINWLSTYAQPTSGGSGTGNGTGADMLFYENVQGYHFNSLQSLYKQNSVMNLYYNPKNIRPNQKLIDLDSQLRNAMKFEVLNYIDTLGAISKGTFSNRLISLDILAKKKTVTDYNYNDYFKNGKSLNGSPVTNNYKNRYDKYLFDAPPQNMEAGTLRMVTSNSKQKELPYVKQNSDMINSIANDIFVENYIPNRVGQIALANYTRIKLTIPGNSDLCVGLAINFMALGISAISDSKSKKDPDPYFSGKYIITAIRHIITNISYITVLELAKDSNTQNYSGVNNADNNWKAKVAGGQS